MNDFKTIVHDSQICVREFQTGSHDFQTGAQDSKLMQYFKTGVHQFQNRAHQFLDVVCTTFQTSTHQFKCPANENISIHLALNGPVSVEVSFHKDIYTNHIKIKYKYKGIQNKTTL